MTNAWVSTGLTRRTARLSGDAGAAHGGGGYIPPGAGLPVYAHVLLDVLRGTRALSTNGDEAEQAWRIVSPVLEAWENGDVELEEYPAGSAGPQT